MYFQYFDISKTKKNWETQTSETLTETSSVFLGVRIGLTEFDLFIGFYKKEIGIWCLQIYFL